MQTKSKSSRKETKKSTVQRLYYGLNCVWSSVALISLFASDFLTKDTVLTIRCLICFYITLYSLTLYLGVFSKSDNFEWPHYNNAKLTRKVSLALITALIFVVFVTIFHIVAVFFGAPILSSVTETFHFAILLSVLTILPGCLYFGPDTSRWLRLVLGSGSQSGWELKWIQTGVGTVIGSWVGAFAIPLDWDRPWQVWPVSCIYGALIGHLFGHLYTWITNTKLTTQNRKHV